MSEEERISKNLLLFMFIGCLVLLIFVAGFCIFYSPKSMAASYSENIVEEEIGYTSSEDAEEEVNSIFPIPINTATFEELQLIPNIGPSTAQLIIDYRNEYGTIISFNELLSIDGIGEKTVELLKKHCIIN